jgi:membrane-associated phospholipid phosphatase
VITMSKVAWARLGLLVAGALIVAGVGLAIDVAAALMTAGVLLGGFFLLMYDVDEGRTR